MKKEDKKRLAKELLKEWQRTHYQEYCDFSDMMHDRNGMGFDKANSINFLWHMFYI